MHAEGSEPNGATGLQNAPDPTYALHVGAHIQHGGHRGTVRFLGPLAGRGDTEWAGIEWDDAARGRHSGAADGRQYFTCITPGAASFIKRARLASGGRVALLDAVRQRYVADAADGTFETERHVVGGGVVDLQALRAARGAATLRELRVVDVSGMGVAVLRACARAGAGLAEELAGLRELRVARSLFEDVDVLHELLEALPALTLLDASRNVLRGRAEAAGVRDAGAVAHASLRVLVLNHSAVRWEDVAGLAERAPGLQELRLHNCSLGALGGAAGRVTRALRSLRVLDLDGNAAGWAAVTALGGLAGLRELYASRNGLEDSGALAGCVARGGFPTLETLSLAGNPLRGWRAVAALHGLPRLRALRLAGAELPAGAGMCARMRAVARVGGLRVLDGSVITADERLYAERRYLREEVASAVAGGRGEEHPRAAELRARFGEVAGGRAAGAALRARTVRVEIGVQGEGRAVVRMVPRGVCVRKVAGVGKRLLGVSGRVDVRVGGGVVEEAELGREVGGWDGGERGVLLTLVRV